MLQNANLGEKDCLSGQLFSLLKINWYPHMMATSCAMILHP